MTLVFLIFSGCAAGPKYTLPAVSVPDTWTAPRSDTLKAKEEDSRTLADWWTQFRDPVLTELIDRAIRNNPDIRIATARVREARARRGIAASGYFPFVNANVSASGSRTQAENGDVTTRDTYSAGFDAGWELDIFGGTKYSVEAAEAQVGASIESRRDMRVSVTAEVALNYTDVRTYQTRIAIADTNLALQKDTYDITRWRAEAGLTTQLDVEQARYSLEQTRSSLPTLNTGLAEAKNRLAVLLGQQPMTLEELLSERKPIPDAPIEVAVGVPADAVRRRPDIRQAERLLAAQTAETGAAEAARYPSFTLNGSTGLESLNLADLLSAGTWISSISAGIGYPVFHAGSLRQNVVVQTALQEQALVEYESAVLNALEEVDNALIAFAGEQMRRRSLGEAAESARNAVTMVTIEYTAGQKDFQSLLEAQRSLFNLQDQLASSEGQIVSDLIRLYKALGGGWTPLTPSGENE
jgi:NodT family efflux transporter outer membrane factor (OMF) lipoprotein